MKQAFYKIREQRIIDKTRETKILCSAFEKIQFSQMAQSLRKIMLYTLSNHVQRQSDMINARQAEISQQLKQLNEKDTFMKVQEAIFLTMKDNKSSSLLQNASTDHYSEREFTQNDKQKRMSEINRTVKQNDQTPPQALRPIVTERLSSGLGMTNKSINKHHSKSPQINIMIQRTPTSSNVYKSAVVQLESAKQTSITLQAQKAVKGTGAQNNRYSKNTPETVVSQMSESKQHVMQQLSSKQAPKQFELNLKLAREQNTVELESPLRNANPASFRFGKDKSPPATLPIQQFKASYISSSTIPNVQSSVSSFNSLKSSEFLSTSLQPVPPRPQTMMVSNTVEHMHRKLHRLAASQLLDKLTTLHYTHSLKPAFTAISHHAKQQRHREGAQLLVDWASRRLVTKALVQWLRTAYEEEITLQESLEAMRGQKLMRAIYIGERSTQKDEVLLIRMFREWKRQGYEMVLEGLKKYSQTLDSQERKLSASATGKAGVSRTNGKVQPQLSAKSPRRVTTPQNVIVFGSGQKPIPGNSSTGGIGGGFSANVASYSSMFQSRKKGYF
ncbi:hypothetical protein FGO68_gene6539 [Halteria grandinella]|uniref:Uncharacterized protein n=1 Tax=Halteria grandinella TaxID=5974 RepID=A0A8J8P0X3_HALGN|nr:hypothetical protein FGO68_gene6539 [Halteria grandinella]